MRKPQKGLQKNRLLLQLLLMSAMLLLVSAAAAVFLGNTVITSFYGDCSVFDDAMDSLAMAMERQIGYQKNTLNNYGKMLYHAGDSRPQEIQERLGEMENDSFSALVWITQEGSCYSTQEQTLSREEAEAALQYLRDYPIEGEGFYFGSCGTDGAFYAVSCSLAEGTGGALAGIVPADVIADNLSGELKLPGTSLYLLNENKEAVLFGGDGVRDFQYDAMERHLFFDTSSTPLEQAKTLYEEWKNLEQAEAVRRLLDGNETVCYEKPVRAGDGRIWRLVVCRPAVLAEDSAIIIRGSVLLAAFIILFSFILMLVLVVSQGISSKRLRQIAYFDAVTGKHNWSWLQLEGARLCSRKKRKNSYVMVSMDIRRFRIISDVDGEMRSDAVLKQTAEVLDGLLGKKERFARFSVDEFALLLICSSEQEAVDRVHKINAALRGQALLRDIEFCYGIYAIHDYTMPLRKMYNYAGIARDCMKGSHENFIGIFDDSMRESMVREKELESRMESAMKQREFLVYLQPKYTPDGSRIGGAEALVRWISPELGFLSPGEFIPLFEKNGFITRLDIYMLRSICELQAGWQCEGRELLRVSVNISRVHLMNPMLVQSITNMADAYGVPHGCIELEITESAFFEDQEMLSRIVMELKEAGFSVSMDDFGAGYSSLNSLKDLQIDVIKLDGEFFHYANNRERSETVIRDTVSLAKHLNMTIVAEGIETKEQAEFLQEIGCDYIQGYYFAKPMPVQEFEKLMGYSAMSVKAPVPSTDAEGFAEAGLYTAPDATAQASDFPE